MPSTWSTLAVITLSAIAIAKGTDFRVPSLEQCRPDPTALSTSTLIHDGSEVVIKTISCPGVVKPAKRSISVKRQTFDQCGIACSFLCFNFDQPTPVEQDCIVLAQALTAEPGSFVTPSGSITTATLGTCETVWVNNSDVEYEYCYADWGPIVYDIGSGCIPAGYTGGLCDQIDENWAIEVFI